MSENRLEVLHDGDTSFGVSRILLHSPDITLKGKNQNYFQKALCKNIKHRLSNAGFKWDVVAARGRVYVNTAGQSEADIRHALSLLQELAGVSSLAAASYLRPTEILTQAGEMHWQALEEVIVGLARHHYLEDASFAIRVNRTDKRLPAKSNEMCQRLGEVVRQRTAWDRVDLKHADQTFYIDGYPDGLYCYGKKLKGLGGLPVGTGGRVLSLLSGGIDSPVASALMAIRGCHVDLFHMSASHIRETDAESSVIARLACRISCYTQHSRLFMVPYTYFDLALRGERSGYELVLFRRFLMRTAETLAQRIHAQALINGDSLGQVASQTLENLVSSSRAIEMPILRPLIGTNKDDIIRFARQLGTYPISIEPYKDCCALIARSPKTRSRHEHLMELEDRLLPDYAQIIEDTLKDMICLEFDCGERVEKC